MATATKTIEYTTETAFNEAIEYLKKISMGMDLGINTPELKDHQVLFILDELQLVNVLANFKKHSLRIVMSQGKFVKTNSPNTAIRLKRDLERCEKDHTVTPEGSSVIYYILPNNLAFIKLNDNSVEIHTC